MGNILCCRNIIVLWYLNLISKDIFDDFGIQTFLTSSPMLMWNAVFVGCGCTFGCDAIGV